MAAQVDVKKPVLHRGPRNLNPVRQHEAPLERAAGDPAMEEHPFPRVVGLAAPVHVLERVSGVDDIVNMAVIAAVDAQERGRRRASPPPDTPTLRSL